MGPVISKPFWLDTSNNLKKEKIENCYLNSQDIIIEILKLMCMKLQTQTPPPEFTKKISKKWLPSKPPA